MFRKMRRFKQSLTENECAEILKKERRGILAVNGDDGYPYAVPINYFYDEADKKIYFHCSREGHKIDAITACDKVCFTVYETGVQREDWSYYVRSVIVFGRASIIEDWDFKLEKAKSFGMKYYPSEEELNIEIEKDFDRVMMIGIDTEHMTGKLVHEK